MLNNNNNNNKTIKHGNNLQEAEFKFLVTIGNSKIIERDYMVVNFDQNFHNTPKVINCLEEIKNIINDVQTKNTSNYLHEVRKEVDKLAYLQEMKEIQSEDSSLNGSTQYWDKSIETLKNKNYSLTENNNIDFADPNPNKEYVVSVYLKNFKPLKNTWEKHRHTPQEVSNGILIGQCLIDGSGFPPEVRYSLNLKNSIKEIRNLLVSALSKN